IWELDGLTGRSTALGRVDGARRIVLVGPEQNMLVVTPNALVLLSRDGKPLNRLVLTAPVADVAYDAAHNQIVAVSARSDTLQVFDSGLTQPAVSVALPWTPCYGDKVSIQYDPVSGAFLLHCDGSP